VSWPTCRDMSATFPAKGLRREDERAVQGQATQPPASTMRGQEGGATRGRDDGPTTSWCNKTTRGGTTTRRHDERVASREATQQPAGATRGREGGMGHNERTRRGDVATSWCNELTRGWRNERTVRGNATTSWCDKTTRGQRNERTARGDATTSWCNKTTRGLRNERTTRGYVTTSWHDKTTPGRHDERQHKLVVFPWSCSC
jgi:hypothetical protein